MSNIIEKKNTVKKAIATIDPTLDSYKNQPFASRKLAEANAFLEKAGLPKGFYNPNIEQQNLSFQDTAIRRILQEDNWVYNLVDVIEALTDCAEPRKYWADFKKNTLEIQGKTIKQHGTFLLPNNNYYPRDAAPAQEILEILPLISSTKTEAFRTWLTEIEND